MKKKMSMLALSTVAMLGFTGNQENLWAQGRTDLIAQSGQAAPDGNGTFFQFDAPVINDSGMVAFEGQLIGTALGTRDNNGLFRGTGGSLTQVARAGQLAPDGNGRLVSFGTPALNNAGTVTFFGQLTGTSGGGADDRGIFRGSGGSLTQIARRGQLAPDGNGTLQFFNAPLLNESGGVAFSTTLNGTSGGNADDSGIYRGIGGNLTQIAREGQIAQGGNGVLGSFNSVSLNDSNALAFQSILFGTSGGSSDNLAIYAADGIDFLQVVRTGELMLGSTVSFVQLVGEDSFNNWGQVAYRATLGEG